MLRSAILALAALLAFAGPVPFASGNVLDPDVVDFVVVEKDDSVVFLDIVQHLPWSTDTYNRLDRKVDRYMQFYSNGSLLRTYPNLAGKRVTIRVVYVEPPGPAAVWRLEAIRSRIKPRGVALTWVPLEGPPQASQAR